MQRTQQDGTPQAKWRTYTQIMGRNLTKRANTQISGTSRCKETYISEPFCWMPLSASLNNMYCSLTDTHIGGNPSQAKRQYNTTIYNTIQYNTIQYNTIQYNTIQYNTVQYNTKQYNQIYNHNTMQCNTTQYNTIHYNTIQYNTIQYNTIQYNTIQCNTIQYNC